jgi:hypothetical protein
LNVWALDYFPVQRRTFINKRTNGHLACFTWSICFTWQTWHLKTRTLWKIETLNNSKPALNAIACCSLENSLPPGCTATCPQQSAVPQFLYSPPFEENVHWCTVSKRNTPVASFVPGRNLHFCWIRSVMLNNAVLENTLKVKIVNFLLKL